MKKIVLLTLFTALMMSTTLVSAQKGWTRIYTSNGRSVSIPDTWTSEESVVNGVRQLIAVNPKGKAYMAIFFYEGQATAGERMDMMISHNNIDVVESATETFGALKVMTKKGKMKYNKKKYKVLISTADGAGQQWNVVGALWGPEDAFKNHKAKFEEFFTSVQ